MNKRISDLLNEAAEEIELEDSGMFDARRVTDRVKEKLHAERKTGRPRRLWRTVLIAAVITSLLAAMAIAASAVDARVILPGLRQLFGKTEAYTPGEGEIFLDAGPNGEFNVSHARHDIGMILRYEVPRETKKVFVKANWLPGTPSYMSPLSRYISERQLYGKSDWVEKTNEPDDNEEYLALLGLSENELDSWDSGYFYSVSGEGEIKWELMLWNGDFLYKRDMVLGMYGGEGTVVREWTEGDFSCTEIDLDYSASENPAVAKRGVYHYLMMFNEQEHYLAELCGTDSYETLEKIAQNLEFHVSGITYTAAEPDGGVWIFGFADAGQG